MNKSGQPRFPCVLALILVMAAPAALGEEEDPFEALDRLLDDNFETIDRSLEEQFEMMDAAMENAYQRLGQEVERQWGKEEVRLPSQKEWVDYSEDMKTRRSVNFESGTIELEKIIDMSEGADSIIRDMLEAATSIRQDSLKDLADKDLAMKYARKSLLEQGIELSPPPAPDDQPVLAEITEPVDATRLQAAVAQALQQKVSQPVRAGGSTLAASVQPMANNRRKIKLRIPLKEGYQSDLAGRYMAEIAEQAERHDLNPSLLLAVMETESSFNPRARSGVPAYGLMQLVPRSGAMDAYQYVYGEKKLVDPEYLYSPENNVELGSAYLNLLQSRYLRHITNPLSREYCAIAAYNTGAGNVARTFTGDRNVREAAKIINNMEPHEVYNFLKDHLPHEETRRYIVKVTRAQAKFQSYDRMTPSVGSAIANPTSLVMSSHD